MWSRESGCKWVGNGALAAPARPPDQTRLEEKLTGFLGLSCRTASGKELLPALPLFSSHRETDSLPERACSFLGEDKRDSTHWSPVLPAAICVGVICGLSPVVLMLDEQDMSRIQDVICVMNSCHTFRSVLKRLFAKSL